MPRFVSFHDLRSLPPNLVNADGNRRPKTTWFGGVPRARVSSQAWKRARREHLVAGGLATGVRTRLIRGRLAEELTRSGRDPDEASVVARAALEAIGLAMDGSRPEATQYLLFLGSDEIDGVVDVLLQAEVWDALRLAGEAAEEGGKKAKRSAAGTAEAREALLEALENSKLSVDLALFGRMIADRDDLEVAAAVQVAHSIGVARHVHQTDFFTAVDELALDGGAGMVGTSWYSSSVIYGYTAVDLGRLTENLLGDGDLVRQTLAGYLTATVEAVPGGRRNSFAADTLPALVLASVGDRAPYSLANAYQAPVRARDADGDLVAAAVGALDRHLQWTQETHGRFGRRGGDVVLVAGRDLPLADLERTSVQDLIERVVAEAVEAG